MVTWADPDSGLSAAILTSGKPFLDLEVLRLYQLLMAIARELPKVVA